MISTGAGEHPLTIGWSIPVVPCPNWSLDRCPLLEKHKGSYVSPFPLTTSTPSGRLRSSILTAGRGSRPMPNELATITPAGDLSTGRTGFILPAAIADQGDKAAERFFTFFTDTIPNAN